MSGEEEDSVPLVDCAVVLKGTIEEAQSAAKAAFVEQLVARCAEVADEIEVGLVPGAPMPETAKGSFV